MGGKAVVVLVAFLAIGGFALWLFAGGGLAVLGLSTEPEGGGRSAPMPSSIDGDGTTPTEGGGAPASREAKQAVLFGRPRIERQGLGALSARVLRAKDRAPVAGAALLLSGESNGGAAVNLRATSDAQGAAVLKDVPAGDDYLVRVEATGGEGTWLPGVRLEPGSAKDLGDLLVGSQAPLVGRVVDEAGKPIRDARVAAFPGYGNLNEMMSNFFEIIGNLDREPKALAETKSDADGRFRLEGLPTGTLVVSASAPGRTRAQREVGMTPTGSGAGDVTLTLLAGATVSGKVVDGEARGVAGARLAIIAESGGAESFLLGRTFATADETGAFEATVPDSGDKLRAFVAADGFPTAYSTQFRPGDKDVRIVLLRGSTLELLVETKTHRPVEGAQVLVMLSSSASMDDPESNGTVLYATTGADGRVTLAGRPGRVEMLMVTSAAGVAMGSPSRGGMDFMAGAVQFELEVPEALEAGKTHRGVVRLAGETITMEGRVLDLQGNGLSGVTIKPFSMMGMAGGAKSTVSGEGGAYRLEGLSPTFGSMLILSAPGWVQQGTDFDMGSKDRKPGEVVKKDWTMAPAATVRGRVLDASAAPVPGAHVSWNGGTPHAMLSEFAGTSGTTTNLDGSYVLFDVDAGTEGKGTVSAHADGFVAGKSEEVKVAAGGSATAKDVVLTRGATVRGTVFEANGRRAAGARVEYSVESDDQDSMAAVREAMRGKGRAVRTAADGGFAIPTLPKGKVTLTASAPGAAAVRRILPVEADKDPAPVELRLKQGGRVAGSVFDAEGRPLADATVRLESVTEENEYVAPQSVHTTSDGTFVIDGVPLVRVGLKASAEGHVEASATASAGGPSVEIRLTRVDPDDARRMAEIDKEIQRISMTFSSAKTDDERAAVSKQLMELMQEKKKLEKKGVKSATNVEEVPGTPDAEPEPPEPAMR